MTYTFDSKVWTRLFPRSQQFNLEHNFRQGDVQFRRLLERMRRGYLGKGDHALLKGLRREPLGEETIQPVHLYVLPSHDG